MKNKWGSKENKGKQGQKRKARKNNENPGKARKA